MPRRRTAAKVRSAGAGRSDPFELLVAEHDLLRDSLRRARRDRGTLEAFERAVRAHIERETRSLYPLCEQLFGGPEGAVAVLRQDHDALDAELRTVSRAAGRRAESAAHMESLAARLEDHFAREERVLFPLMAALLTGNDSGRLASLLRTSP